LPLLVLVKCLRADVTAPGSFGGNLPNPTG
jgi:hypothetical protein